MMKEGLSKNELEVALATARIGWPISGERHPAVVETLKHLDNEGYLDVVEAIAEREGESGISYKEAVQDYRMVLQMGRRKEELGRAVVALEERVRAMEAERKNAVLKARDAKSEQAWEEQRLQSMRENARQEEVRSQERIERARGRENMSLAAIETAGRINAQVQEHGLDLDVVLKVCEEFGTDEGASERLAVQLLENRTLTEASAALQTSNQRMEAQRQELQEQVTALQTQKARLTEDIEEQKYLRRFHRRYDAASPILESLYAWNAALFLRCGNTFCGARFVVERSAPGILGLPPVRDGRLCPSCGRKELVWDPEVYRALGLPSGPVRIPLGD